MREARAWQGWESRPQRASGYWLVQEGRGGSTAKPRHLGGGRVGAGQVGAGHALIVNDDPEVRRALAGCLGPELVVHLAASVRQARAVVAGLKRVDLAFVDVHLPDGSGEEVLELLRKWPDAIAVLIASAVPAPAASGSAAASASAPGVPGAPAGSSGSVPMATSSGPRRSPDLPTGPAPRGAGPGPGGQPAPQNMLKNRALANLVLARPIAPRVVEALKQAALASSK